jgi:CsoR family transcriptional regulator, copper-sensing transcriptional repressor
MSEHKHPHNKAVINRLSKIIGHMEAIKRMVEEERDCSDILIQISAVRSALNNTGKVILEDHINHCVAEAVEKNDKKVLENLTAAMDKFIK